MKRSACLGLILGGLSLAGCVGLSAGNDDPPPPDAGSDPPLVALDLGKRFQTLEGFGAAVAWYGETLASRPDKEEIYSLIFGELGLDIIRFRNRYQRSNEPATLTAELELLDRAHRSLGHPPRVLLSSWSPPAALKANGQEKCHGQADATTCTLINSGGFPYAAFANYWYDSLQYYAASGIVPDFVTLQNELDFVPTGWEGCRFDPTEGTYPGFDQALRAVHARLADMPNDPLAAMRAPPRILGPETQGIHYGRIESYLAAMDLSLVHGGAHHLYERQVWRLPDDYQAPMNTLRGAQPSLPLFQTEFSTNGAFTEGGFETAWVIHDSLVTEGVSAFLYWELVWPGGGLVSLETDALGNVAPYVIRDQYYSVRHYARFTDPGYVRIGATSNVSDVRVSAFIAPDQSQVTVVLLNVGTSARTVTLDLGGYAALSSTLYRTVFGASSSADASSGTDPWRDLGSLGTERAVELPSRSVVTVVLAG